MEKFLSNIMPIVYIAAGAFISNWYSKRTDKSKRKGVIKSEIGQIIYLLFGRYQLYVRQTTLSKVHEVYHRIVSFKFQISPTEDLKYEKDLYHSKMQDEINSALRNIDEQMKLEGDLVKLSFEVNEIFDLSTSKKYRTIIDDCLKYGRDPKVFGIAEGLTEVNYETMLPVINSKMIEQEIIVGNYGLNLNKKLDSIV